MRKGPKGIDPKLRDRLNRSGEAIVKSIRKVPKKDPAKPKGEFRPDRPGKTLVLDDRGIDSMTIPVRDGDEVVGIEFYREKKPHLIDRQGLRKLNKLVDEFSLLPAFSRHVSEATIWNCVTTWVKERYRKRTRRKVSTYVLEEISERVQDYEAYVPILHLSIEKPFQIGPVLLVPLTEDWFARIELQLDRSIYTDSKQVAQYVEENRERFQGFAAATIEISAETEVANHLAFIAAQLAVDCLLFCSDAMEDPTKTTQVEVSNLTPAPSTASFLFSGGELASTNQKMVGPDRYGWAISHQAYERLKPELDRVASLLFRETDVPFRQEVQESFKWYVQVPRTERIYQKLVYAMMALESLLLKDDEEKPSSLWPRFANVLATTQAEYDKHVRFGRDVYAVRSRLLHHGKDVGDIDLVGGFLKLVRQFMRHVLEAVDRFSTKEDFLDSITSKAPKHSHANKEKSIGKSSMKISNTLEQPRGVTFDWHVTQAIRWLDFDGGRQLDSTLVHAALELRLAIERYFFELLLLFRGGKVSPEDEKRSRSMEGMAALLKETDNQYRKTIEFTKILSKVVENGPEITIADTAKLRRTWSKLSEYCHQHLRPDKTFGCADRSFQKKGFKVVDQTIQEFSNWDHESNCGVIRPSDMEPEVRDLYHRFIKSEIDASQVRVSLDLMKPVLTSRFRSR